jgi:hypothetical protein
MKESTGIILWVLTTMIMTAIVVGFTYLAVGKIPMVVLVATIIYEGAMVAALWAFYNYVLIDKSK